MKACGKQFESTIADCMRLFLGTSLNDTIADFGDIRQKFASVFLISVQVLVPIFLVVIGISVVATFAQTKLLFAPKALTPKLSKLNPINGIKNLFSARQIGETLKSILKIIIIGYIMYTEIKANIPQLLTIHNMNVATSVAWTADFVLSVCFKACAAFVVIGVIDYFYQWWNYERRMRMSKEEVKEEYKQTEGNPETKSRIKSEQRRIAQRRQMQAVPSADVVIRNPTHYAVALKYDRGKMHAPVVVAKGQNLIAQKIVEIAMASHVHIVENVPLAQALYKTVEVGDEIPEQFYKAVAEILAYIYKLKRAGRS